MLAPVIPADWPFRSASQHVRCKGHLWHVQEIGSGPVVLLLHGAGGATHSFRHLIPLLSTDYRVIALDLPGQGFTSLGNRARCNLDAMAEDVAALIAQQGWHPVAIIGHSAGAAVALRLAEISPPQAVIGINAALGGFEGVAGWLFPALANLLARLPLVPQLFSKLAGTTRQVHQLLASTGSRIDAAGEAQYLHLLRQPGHVAATLAMMAQWQLDGLLNRLPQQVVPCLLITASADRAVPPVVSQRAAAVMSNAEWIDLPRFGHLVHEEAPEQVAALIRDFLEARAKADPLCA
ncbi:alpha/beta fold hydrolase BchO [Cypionkella sp. TWP1-2-1b2]|uniref:alpha/beta fold hydrolase BchO n=1 Tax=Cypionkella sp. TWP1-2-1b2 TaxID=2804675 RepID=UPI003CF53470